jgi:hypothetical protein
VAAGGAQQPVAYWPQPLLGDPPRSPGSTPNLGTLSVRDAPRALESRQSRREDQPGPSLVLGGIGSLEGFFRGPE